VKAKNAELLDELKTARKSRATDALQERAQALESEKTELEQRVYHYEVEKPRVEMMKRLAVSDTLAEVAMREILHRFDIGEDDALLNKDGSPLMIEEKDRSGDVIGNLPLKFDDDGVEALYKHGILPVLGHMLRGSQASGGGAPGSTGNNISRPSPVDEKPEKASDNVPTFGMR
jgi:hypothetical protein